MKDLCHTGTCYDVPLPCPGFKKYADVTDCVYFFQCYNGVLYRDKCREEYGFGIYEEDCVYVTSDFNCEERCLDTFTTAQQCKLHVCDEILMKRFSFSINVLFMNE